MRDEQVRIQFSWPALTADDALLTDLRSVIESGWVSDCENVQWLTEHCRAQFGVRHAIACSSATQALLVAIKAAGWAGRNILTPAFTWPSADYAIAASGGKSVYGDIDPLTWCLDPLTASAPYQGIIAADTFGCPAVIDSPEVIYDAAFSYGQPGVGGRGRAEIISFSYTKIPTAYEGGMILTNDDGLASRAAAMSSLSCRLSELHAVIAKHSIAQMPGRRRRRQEMTARYRDILTIPYQRQQMPCGVEPVVMAIRVPAASRPAMLAALSANRVEYKCYYESLAPGLPETERLCREILCLPFSDRLTDAEICLIGEILNGCCHGD